MMRLEKPRKLGKEKWKEEKIDNDEKINHEKSSDEDKTSERAKSAREKH